MHSFRRATPDDFDFILSIGRLRYTSPLIDWTRGEAWLHSALASPHQPCFLGARSFGFLHIAQPMWEPKPQAILSFFAARPGRDLEPLALMRVLAAYAKAQGCSTLDGGADTGADVGILLRRIGARNVPRFRLDL